jgi:hypothetical protein
MSFSLNNGLEQCGVGNTDVLDERRRLRESDAREAERAREMGQSAKLRELFLAFYHESSVITWVDEPSTHASGCL